jgi:putative NADH-flavin reductase
MDFLVFGATGRTGAAFIRQATAAGHRVAAFVRNAASLPAAVEVRAGDVLDVAAVRGAIRPGETMVVTLGGTAALTTGTANVVAAADAEARILGVVGAGVLQADPERQRHQLPDYPPRFREIGAAHQAFYAALRDSALVWTLACTPRLADGDYSGRYAALADYLPDGSGAITTEDVAAFLLEEAAVTKYARRRVGLNS